MNFLQNRMIAAVIMVLLIVVGMVAGTTRTLRDMRSDAQQVFYSGETGDGLGIQRDLDERVDLSYNLLTIAKKYMSETDWEIKAVEDARKGLEESYTPSEKYAANKKLTEAVTELYNVLGEKELSESDERYRQRLHTDMNSRNDTIANDPYNKIATEFNEKLEAFPAKYFAQLTSVDKIDLYR